MSSTKVVYSEERTTGMGATRFTAVAVDGQWIKVSDLPNAVYCGRNNGVHEYKVTIDNSVIVAYFYRSNSGREEVAIQGVEENLRSFQLANEWLAEAAKS